MKRRWESLPFRLSHVFNPNFAFSQRETSVVSPSHDTLKPSVGKDQRGTILSWWTLLLHIFLDCTNLRDSTRRRKRSVNVLFPIKFDFHIRDEKFKSCANIQSFFFICNIFVNFFHFNNITVAFSLFIPGIVRPNGAPMYVASQIVNFSPSSIM